MKFRVILIMLVRCYQRVISPLYPPVCRFQPTCSEYLIQAIDKKGIVIGIFYGIKRLLRCHPLGGKGYDPVE
ncbi:MAG: membrane protein insertion efficiency factor YidD [Planctomycetota bacterium]